MATLSAPGPADLGWMHALNQSNAVALSDQTAAGFAALVETAWRVRIVPRRAFLIAFDHTAAYDSANFRWFRARYDRFAYVDRVAVDAAAQGQGLARRLYADLFAAARTAGLPQVVAEVNADPPNPASDAFHARIGFRPVGEARLANGKTVGYLACDATCL